MRFHPYGEEQKPVVIMLPGSFCNADTMANIITKLVIEFRILAVDYNGQYAGSERPFTSRSGEAAEILLYLREHAISSVALIYGQSMGGEMGMELLSQLKKNGITVGAAFFDGGPFLRFPKAVSKLLVLKAGQMLKQDQKTQRKVYWHEVSSIRRRTETGHQHAGADLSERRLFERRNAGTGGGRLCDL